MIPAEQVPEDDACGSTVKHTLQVKDVQQRTKGLPSTTSLIEEKYQECQSVLQNKLRAKFLPHSMQFPAKQTIPGEHHWHRQWSYTLTTAASFETVCAMNADPWIPCGSSASLVLLNQSSLVLVLFPSFYYCCCPYPTWFIHFAQVLFPSCCFRIYKGDTYFPKLIHMPLLKVLKKTNPRCIFSL